MLLINACSSLPEVDSIKTISNNVHEILITLGIEAARNSIINELYRRELTITF